MKRTLGDYGDCGNYAIALQRKQGGELWGVFELMENEEILQHVIVKQEHGFIDVYQRYRTINDVFERMYGLLGTEDLTGIEDIFAQKITREYIFNQLTQTSEKRISEILTMIPGSG